MRKEFDMKTQINIKQILISVLAFGLMCGATTVLAQQERPATDVLAPLKMALRAAGAPELSPAQESEIRALVAEFRDAHPRLIQNADIPNARKAYEEAILNGDSAGAASQAEAIVEERLNNTVQRQADAAAFAVHVIEILGAGSDQTNALTTQLGTRGFVRLILRLVNRPGGPILMGRQAGFRQRAGNRLARGFAIP